LLLLEGFVFISLGLLVGVGIGTGLAFMMQPFLSQILPPLRGGFVLDQILINWFEVGLRFVTLVGFYAIGLIFLMIAAFRDRRSAQF
jgi:hypothetical protein